MPSKKEIARLNDCGNEWFALKGKENEDGQQAAKKLEIERLAYKIFNKSYYSGLETEMYTDIDEKGLLQSFFRDKSGLKNYNAKRATLYNYMRMALLAEVINKLGSEWYKLKGSVAKAEVRRREDIEHDLYRVSVLCFDRAYFLQQIGRKAKEKVEVTQDDEVKGDTEELRRGAHIDLAPDFDPEGIVSEFLGAKLPDYKPQYKLHAWMNASLPGRAINEYNKYNKAIPEGPGKQKKLEKTGESEKAEKTEKTEKSETQKRPPKKRKPPISLEGYQEQGDVEDKEAESPEDSAIVATEFEDAIYKLSAKIREHSPDGENSKRGRKAFPIEFVPKAIEVSSRIHADSGKGRIQDMWFHLLYTEDMTHIYKTLDYRLSHEKEIFSAMFHPYLSFYMSKPCYNGSDVRSTVLLSFNTMIDKAFDTEHEKEKARKDTKNFPGDGRIPFDPFPPHVSIFYLNSSNGQKDTVEYTKYYVEQNGHAYEATAPIRSNNKKAYLEKKVEWKAIWENRDPKAALKEFRESRRKSNDD